MTEDLKLTDNQKTGLALLELTDNQKTGLALLKPLTEYDYGKTKNYKLVSFNINDNTTLFNLCLEFYGIKNN